MLTTFQFRVFVAFSEDPLCSVDRPSENVFWVFGPSESGLDSHTLMFNKTGGEGRNMVLH